MTVSGSLKVGDPAVTLETLTLHQTATATATPSDTPVTSSPRASHYLLQRTHSMLQESSAQLVRYERSFQVGQVVQSVFFQQGMKTMEDIRRDILTLHSEVAKNDEVKELKQTILNLQLAAEAQTKRMEEMHKQSVKLQERSIRMQQEVLDRLTLIQSKVAAIMTQSYELHEYPIPRLFIVLPKEDTTRTEMFTRGIKNVFTKQFKLYFLCECGDHTKPADGVPTNPNLKHEIHIARHEGYDIDRPTEFFDKYGSYILTLLQMLKYGVAIAGVIVPPLGQLKIVDSLEDVAGGIDHVLKDIGSSIDSSIAYIEGLTGIQSQMPSSDQDSSTNPATLTDPEALEGADLRQLDSFLRTKDEGRVFGNLYRTVTSEGHVKWVCLDHYREKYRAKATQDLRDAVHEIDGKYNESIGNISVKLLTPTAARRFFSILKSSHSVQELDIALCWNFSMQDLRDFRDAVKPTNIFYIRLDGRWSEVPLSDFLNNGQRSDPILQLMSGGNIQTFKLKGWDGFLDSIGNVPAAFGVRKLQVEICSLEKWPKRASRLFEILRASPFLAELDIYIFCLIEDVWDVVVASFKHCKLSQGLKLKVKAPIYHRGPPRCKKLLVEFEPHTGKILSTESRCDYRHIHITHHKGYDHDRPTECFDNYGTYNLMLLHMSKYGTTTTGIVVPPLAQLKIVNSLDNVEEDINHILKDIGPRVDSSIAYIKSLTGVDNHLSLADSTSAWVDSSTLGGLKALEGEDLRHLDSFLRLAMRGECSETCTGLSRPYCEDYLAKAAQDLRYAVQKIDEEYSEAIGSVNVRLPTTDRREEVLLGPQFIAVCAGTGIFFRVEPLPAGRRILSVGLRVMSLEESRLFNHALLRSIHIGETQDLRCFMDRYRMCPKTNTGLNGIEIFCSTSDISIWLAAFQELFTKYPQQTARLCLSDSIATVSTSNIHDLTVTKIDISHHAISAGYLTMTSNSSTVSVKKLALSTSEDIEAPVQFWKSRPKPLHLTALDIYINRSSNLSNFYILLEVLEELRVLNDLQFRVYLHEVGHNSLFHDPTCYGVFKHFSKVYIITSIEAMCCLIPPTMSASKTMFGGLYQLLRELQ
ncbi:hypothetical protein BG015_001146 [Linnemannia schmuckeri]|uniref:Uncharacterized protein n=1 Tax=Linnemannia schmuckeri TaxID=64567 RepID=A0A9P5VE29_9FUNG|nr:hypothetical protein BG015_001146 [Linnemannia schmuckeri]